MAYSTGRWISTGTMILPVPAHIDRGHILVFVNGVQTHTYTWTAASNIQITAPVGALIEIRRASSPTALLTTYNDGIPESVARDVDSKQAFYLVQEVSDKVDEKVASLEAVGAILDSRLDTLEPTVAATAGSLAAAQALIASQSQALQATNQAVASLQQSQTLQDLQIASLSQAVAALAGVPEALAVILAPASGITESTFVQYTVVYNSNLPILEYQWRFLRNGVELSLSSLPSPATTGADFVQVRLRSSAGWGVWFGRGVPLGSIRPTVTDISSNAPPAPIPLGTSITFTESHAGIGVDTWEWTFRVNGTIVGTSAVTNPSFVAPINGMLRAEVRVTSANGTSDTYGEDIGIIGVPAPVVQDIAFTPSTGLTTETAVAFGSTVTGTMTSSSWVFKTNGVQVGTSSLGSPTFTFTTPGLARAELVVTGPGGPSAVFGEDLGTVTSAGSAPANRLITESSDYIVDEAGNRLSHQ